jgi:hypothetical protein
MKLEIKASDIVKIIEQYFILIDSIGAKDIGDGDGISETTSREIRETYYTYQDEYWKLKNNSQTSSKKLEISIKT